MSEKPKPIICHWCNKNEASCFGNSEGDTPDFYACDECCAHGNEDGHCEPVKKSTGLKDALTGRKIELHDARNSRCPSCGAFSVISDQPSISRCLRCGWNDD